MAINLKTQYLGLNLPHPFIAGASPLIYNLDTVKRLEDAGAAAIVMHSLFEEQVEQAQGGERHSDLYPQAAEFRLRPDRYLTHLHKIKETCSCPVIASINGLSEGGWIEYAGYMQEAGADALELNLYFLPRSSDESAAVIEQRAFQVVRMVRQFVHIPVAVKIAPFFTSLMHFAHRMEEAGAQALVLFNRFFQPDIDIENLETVPHLALSDSSELLLRLRWLAVLHGRLRLDLACSGGVVSPEDAIKALLAGADTVQMVSALLKNGVSYMSEIREKCTTWMETHEYKDIQQLRGTMSYLNSPNPDVVGRANYMRILQSWKD